MFILNEKLLLFNKKSEILSIMPPLSQKSLANVCLFCGEGLSSPLMCTYCGFKFCEDHNLLKAISALKLDILKILEKTLEPIPIFPKGTLELSVMFVDLTLQRGFQ